MRINNINNQQNFTGHTLPNLASAIAKHPVAVASLAGCSVVAQKMIMSSSEATIGPVMDIAVGKTITKVTDEKDGRTNDSSKKQAVRTFSQTVGGTITGITIRSACIAGMTALCAKAGEKAGNEIYSSIASKDKANSYLKEQNAKAWGKSLGGAAAICVMMFTNFLLDVPIINWINKKVTDFTEKLSSKKQPQTKEAEQ